MRIPLAARWLAAGTAAAAASTGLGAQLGLLDTSGVRWVHHVLYGAALATGAAAAVLQGVLAERRRAAMAPAVIVLGILGRTRGRTIGHGTLGAIAAATAGLGAIRGG